MTCTRTWLMAAAVTLSAGVPSLVFAQHGPGGHAGASGPPYDAMSQAIFKGTVADVKSGGSALYWITQIHTMGQGHRGAKEKQLLLKTDCDTVRIQLAPTTFLDEHNVEIRKGDVLAVIGSRITIGESSVVLAREIRKGNKTWALRDATGQPLWSSVQTEERGFWTTKKVLVAVVAVKVALLATVLRH